jgi:hypothetical protein
MSASLTHDKREHEHEHQTRVDAPSCILDTFLLISLRISPLHRSHSLRLVTLDAMRGLRSPLTRLPSPISMACVSRKRYSIDWAFSELRAILPGSWGWDDDGWRKGSGVDERDVRM